MRAFGDYNPIVIFIYFISIAGISMFCMNPIYLALSLVGAVILYIIRNGSKQLASHFVFLIMFAVISLINPIFNHNGVTVLFVVNNNPVTREALIYGIASAVMIIAVIYWFRSFSQLITSDRLLYLFGSVSPKLALFISMVFRYIPLFTVQAKKVNQTQTALGIYSNDNAIDSIRGGTSVFSVMVTWALENGIITADSMTARGYGIGHRSFFSLYRFRKSDAFLLSITLTLLMLICIGAAAGAGDFIYYPATASPNMSALSLISYISFCILAFLPSIIELSEVIKWKYLQSKI